jgi:hypothetical protein
LEKAMAEKQTTFTVTDRRKYTTDGELRDPVASAAADLAEEEAQKARAAALAAEAMPEATPGATTPEGEALNIDPDQPEEGLDDDASLENELGPMPTPQESADQNAAYQKSSGQLDEMIREANPSAPPSAQVDFEQVVQSFYLSAVVAMGAAAEPGQKPRVDIIGARQSIDMLAVLIDKTKGNLTGREQKLLQTALFNLRMMFLEITNSIAAQATKAPKPGSLR